MTASVGSTVPKARRRELYLDGLRTAAIVRVVVYHSIGGAWLSWAFPAMGVMFALAGGLMVNSLDRQPATTVIRNRVRRLLPALWVFGAVMVPLMIWQGGKLTDPNTGELAPVWHAVFWMVPLVDPPGNEWGVNVTVVLWYLRTYLWLVILSPVLLAAFRRAPLPTLVAPLALLVGQAFKVIPTGEDGIIWSVVTDLGTFAPCWMLGFAHRTGALKRLPVPALVTFVLMAGSGAIAWALSHPSDGDEGITYDLNGIPIGQALWSIAVILPLLRFAPDASWIGRTPVLGRFVALVNNRAVTIYLWHNVLIDLAFFGGGRLENVGGIWESGISENRVFILGLVVLLIIVTVMLFGWVEDLAARRSPRLWPVGPSAAQVREAEEKDRAVPAADEPAASDVPATDGPYVPTMDGPYAPAAAGGGYAPAAGEGYAPAAGGGYVPASRTPYERGADTSSYAATTGSHRMPAPGAGGPRFGAPTVVPQQQGPGPQGSGPQGQGPQGPGTRQPAGPYAPAPRQAYQGQGPQGQGTQGQGTQGQGYPAQPPRQGRPGEPPRRADAGRPHPNQGYRGPGHPAQGPGRPPERQYADQSHPQRPGPEQPHPERPRPGGAYDERHPDVAQFEDPGQGSGRRRGRHQSE